MVEEAFDVRFYQPLSLIQRDDFAQPFHGLMGVAPRAKTVGAISELGFPNRLQDAGEAVLHDAIFKAGYAQWAHFAIGLEDVSTTGRTGAVGALPHLLAERGEPCVQVQCVVRFAHSVDAGGFISCLAVKAHPQPLRVAQQPHQRGIAWLREFSCPLCEVNKLCGHAHSPLGVVACFPYSLSQTGAPSLPPNYQRSSLLWAPPTPQRLCPLPRYLHLSEGARSSAPMLGSPWLPHNRYVRLDTV